MAVRKTSLLGTLVSGSVLAALLLSGPATAAVETYNIDAGHSNVGFSVRHLVSKTHGRFAVYDGTIAFDPADHTTAVVNLEIDAASINTDSEKRDGHLKTGDFFEVEKYPKISFKSTGVKPLTADTGVLTGDLTMKGITKPVELQYTILGIAPGPRGGKVLGLEATGRINRKDFNVLWNRDLDKGATLLGDDVNLHITVEALEDVPKPAEPAKTN